MTPVRGRIGPWVLVSLALPLVIAGGIQFGVFSDILSPSVWIDIVAVWPIAAAGLVAGPVVWLVAGRRTRHLAIPGLSAFTWLAFGLALHIAASDLTPVSRATVVGPQVDAVESADLSVDLAEGRLQLAAGSDDLYEISPIRAGGNVGAPTAFEQPSDGAMTVVATPRDDPGLYVFRGWEISVAPAVSWEIQLSADELAVDLHGLTTPLAHLESDTSEVRLGVADGPSTLEFLGGRHRVYLDPGSAARLRGEGVVPSDWTIGVDGTASSPETGDGWTIVAGGGAVVEVWYP